MLQKLYIKNYAIIEEITIDFVGSMNIITGETGAGKSILMGALGLILGDRAESNVLHDKVAKCIVEATFGVKLNQDLKRFFAENDIDETDEILIRREIAPNGKSRAFINDTPVVISQLKKIGALLIDLHQQFDTIELGDNDFQRTILDALADNVSLLSEYQNMYRQYTVAVKELEALQLKQKESEATADYNKFLYTELEEASFKENEIEQLEAELKVLNNAENIKQQLDVVLQTLNGSEQPLVQQLKALANKVKSIQEFHTSFEEIANRLQSSFVEIQDIAHEVERVSDQVQFDAERVQLVSDRLALGYKLQKKHNVTATDELLAIQQKLEALLLQHSGMDEAIASAEKNCNKLLVALEAKAAQLSSNRSKAILPFAKQVNVLLKQVGMPNAKIKVALEPASLGVYGKDAIEFLFDANLADENMAGRYEPLRKVASGGELSRLMLCIKSLVAKKLQLPTLIFDEIDTGISGEAAKQVGVIMKELSSSHQLISVTHQPQIAAKADAHFYVHKATSEKGIVTSVKRLIDSERVAAIAQMLGGENPGKAAMENAREMVGV